MEQNTTNKPLRRVGTLTLGVCLIAAGVLFLLARFLPGLPWLVIWQVLPAAGLILLGCEVLYYSARPGACRCDFGSVVLCLLMMGGCFGVSTLMLLAQMLGRGCTIHLWTQESLCSLPPREGLHRLFRLKREVYCTPVSSASLW